MSLTETIDADLKVAMKASDKTSVSTLRLVKSSLKYRQIEKGGNLTDDDVIAVLSSMVKQRRESIEQYTKAGRDDLASSEMAEIEIIKKYLPEQISNEELEAIIRETIKELNASGAKDIGKVMKAVIPKVKGRADGKVINARVTQILSS
jgi:uncharacterized protein YqeY